MNITKGIYGLDTSVQTVMSSVERPTQPLSSHHALLVFTTPRSLFSRVEDTGAYGWSLVLLLGLAIIIGYVEVQSGLIVATGPGIPLPDPDHDDEEPWREAIKRPRHLPMQAEVGDYALFLKKHAVEIRYEGQEYLIVSQGAILVLIRDEPAEG